MHKAQPQRPEDPTEPAPQASQVSARSLSPDPHAGGVRVQHVQRHRVRFPVPILLQLNRLPQPHIKPLVDAPASSYPYYAATQRPRAPTPIQSAAETPSSFPTTRATRGGAAAPGRSPGAREQVHGARRLSCSSSTTPTRTGYRLRSRTDCDELGEN